MTDTTSGSGLFAALRGLLADTLALLRTRGELFVVELAEERLRLARIVLFGAMAFFFLSFGLVMLTIFLTVLLWDSHRLLVIGICTSLFLGSGLLALLAIHRQLRRGSRLFAASLQELEQDIEMLQGVKREH
ncbi:MAG: phage holin family protein [Sterolibacterium sp.]|nr:phage holin family protein [Sterolibacterium sp.]